MRLCAPLLALLAMGGVAHADEARNVPAVGSKLTYRSVSTTTMPRATLTRGEVYTHIVTAAEVAEAEGIIKPRAVIISMQGGRLRSLLQKRLRRDRARISTEIC
jgi:hypothetical protein